MPGAYVSQPLEPTTRGNETGNFDPVAQNYIRSHGNEPDDE